MKLCLKKDYHEHQFHQHNLPMSIFGTIWLGGPFFGVSSEIFHSTIARPRVALHVKFESVAVIEVADPRSEK